MAGKQWTESSRRAQDHLVSFMYICRPCFWFRASDSASKSTVRILVHEDLLAANSSSLATLFKEEDDGGPGASYCLSDVPADLATFELIASALTDPRLSGIPPANSRPRSSNRDEDKDDRKPNARKNLFSIDWRLEDLETLALEFYEPVIKAMILRGTKQAEYGCVKRMLKYFYSGYCKPDELGMVKVARPIEDLLTEVEEFPGEETRRWDRGVDEEALEKEANKPDSNEDKLRMEMERMNNKVIKLEKECWMMRAELQNGSVSSSKAKKLKQSVWGEIKRKLGSKAANGTTTTRLRRSSRTKNQQNLSKSFSFPRIFLFLSIMTIDLEVCKLV
ncbi:hypothetical protein MLD38_027713 [Melastoma candidum]|uniref:Uncharacterized protein n=1 Tax=Melastoma candidum TaxID=119954 RepID=A0ACB9P2M0_9MYRT|nr:hypothetical protein MLD38_027713 [Melastoma candidum]